ncbi:hypothetical protein Tco_0846339 [Tanacetum coccineum]
MRELREDTFSGNRNEDAHDHVDQVLNIVSLFNIPGVSQDAVLLRVLPFTLTGAAKRWVDKHTPGVCPTHDINNHHKVNIFYKGLSTMNRQLLDSYGSIPGMTPTQALMVIKTMADHSQKWHDGTSSRNISSISNTEGLAAIVSKLDNLGHNMKKLKENVHAIQVGCQIFEVPHLDKECPLNEEVKQVEEVNYGEFGRPAPTVGRGPPGYYTRTDNRPPYGEKRPSLEELMNKHHEESVRISAEMKECSSTGQCKVVNNDHETQHRPISSRKLNNKEGWTTKDIQCQLLPKELNPRNFTLPCTIGNFTFYGMADLGASVNVMPRNIFEHLRLANLRNTNMLVEMADMTKKAPLGMPFLATIHAEIDVFDKEISLRTDNNRVSYDMEKKDHNFIIPTEKIFVIKSDLDNRPQPLVFEQIMARSGTDLKMAKLGVIRHYTRIDRYERSTFLMDYILNGMSIIKPVMGAVDDPKNESLVDPMEFVVEWDLLLLPWPDLELHLSGDEFLRKPSDEYGKLEVAMQDGRMLRGFSYKGVTRSDVMVVLGCLLEVIV